MILALTARFCFAGLYDTVFQCIAGEIFVLRLDCSSVPIIQLFGCYAKHPLIDADMYVRIAYHDGKLLGAAVMDCIVQMQLNPPVILFFTDDEVAAMQPRQLPQARQLSPFIVTCSSLQADQQQQPRRLCSSSHEVESCAVADQAQTVVESAADNTPLLVSSDHRLEARAAKPQESFIDTASESTLDPNWYYNWCDGAKLV
jgi:hypothetical protein